MGKPHVAASIIDRAPADDAAPGLGPRAGLAADRAGEWAHYVGAILLLGRSGALAVGAYLISVVIPSAVLPRGPRGAWLVVPAGLVVLGGLEQPNLLLIVALGLTIGTGGALAGRPPALTSGIAGAPGLGGIAGGTAAMVAAEIWGPPASLLLAAGLLMFAGIAGASHLRQGPLPRELVPAGVALAFLMGIRVLEPFYAPGARSALFALAWAAGVQVGWKSSPGADARVVLAAPFIAGGAMTWLGSVSGPAMLFLYSTAGVGAGLVFSVAEASAAREGWPLQRLLLLPFLAAGMVVAGAAASGGEFATVARVAGGACVAGGFLSLAMARRTAAREAAVAIEPVAIAIPPPAAPEGTDDLIASMFEPEVPPMEGPQGPADSGDSGEADAAGHPEPAAAAPGAAAVREGTGADFSEAVEGLFLPDPGEARVSGPA